MTERDWERGGGESKRERDDKVRLGKGGRVRVRERIEISREEEKNNRQIC